MTIAPTILKTLSKSHPPSHAWNGGSGNQDVLLLTWLRVKDAPAKWAYLCLCSHVLPARCNKVDNWATEISSTAIGSLPPT